MGHHATPLRTLHAIKSVVKAATLNLGDRAEKG